MIVLSLDESIESGKEHRKPWRGSKNFDKTCRNHGGCNWCKGNRLYSTTKELERCKEQLKGENLDENLSG